MTNRELIAALSALPLDLPVRICVGEYTEEMSFASPVEVELYEGGEGETVDINCKDFY